MKSRTILEYVFLFTIIILLIFSSFFLSQKSKSNPLNVSALDNNVAIEKKIADIDFADFNVKKIELTESITIAEPGVYLLNGKIEDGNITINTTGNVKLILNGISIKNESGPSLMVEAALNVVIELEENSINEFEDGTKNRVSDYNGCIFSKSDLFLVGKGILNITANYKDGIVSKQGLSILDGIYDIKSIENGIKAKNYIYIENGTINVDCFKDGIKSTNDSNPLRGFIKIIGGNIRISSLEDGIQAETKIIIEEGTFNIKSKSKKTKGNKFFSSVGDVKSLKAKDNIIINGGSFVIDSSGDAISSQKSIGINNANIEIDCVDDAIKASSKIIIDYVELNIKNCYEGLETMQLIINAGMININAYDDGINIAHQTKVALSDSQEKLENSFLIVNQGNIYISSMRDGIDSNGNIEINGGNIIIETSESKYDNSIDFNGECYVNGGTLFAIGSNGLSQIFSEESDQISIMFYLDKYYEGYLEVVDENDNVLFSYNSNNKFSNIIISSNKIDEDKNYILKINGDIIQSIKTTKKANCNVELENEL